MHVILNCMHFMRYLLLFAACITCTHAAPEEKPNIVFILVDDMGWGELGTFHQNQRAAKGQPAMQTPNLDTMAKEGLQLRRHYSSCPVCAPARASLFSGVHQGHAETVRDNSFDIPLENSHTLASVLKQAGYNTALIGKWGLAGGKESGGSPETSSAYPTKRGFDYFFGYLDHIAGHRHYAKDDPHDQRSEHGKNAIWDNDRIVTDDCDKCYSTDLLTARAKKWIIDQKKEQPDKPFFLALTLIAPHAALEIPTMAYPQGKGLKGGLQWLGTPHKLINTAEGKTDSYISPKYANNKWPESAKRHATMIARIDDAVGDILQLLKDLKIDKNTIVIFTSDNGPHNEGSFRGPAQDPTFFQTYGPFDGIKRDTWEGGMREPTLVRYPGFVKKGISTQPSQFHDWMATFADLAGVPSPARCDGVSLVPVLTGKGKPTPGIIYTEYWQTTKTPNYKDFKENRRNGVRQQEQVIYYSEDGKNNYKGVRLNIADENTPFEIYDIDKDPGERNNLAGTKAGAAMQQWMQNRILQIRRPYDYTHKNRGTFAQRPYDKALVPAAAPQPKQTEQGLQGIQLKTACPWVPDSRSLGKLNTPAQALPAAVDPASTELPAGTVTVYYGYLDIPKDGEYKFYLTLDDVAGSKAYVRMHDFQLIDADFNYIPGKEIDSSSAINTTEANPNKTGLKAVPLKAGKHPIEITVVQGEKAPGHMKLSWEGPGIDKQPISAERFQSVKIKGNPLTAPWRN